MSDEPKNNLALDALQKIKEAEAEAQKIIQEAREKTSVKIIQDAHKDADEIKERMLGEARDQARKRKISIIQDAQVEVGKIAEETQAEIDRIRDMTANTKSRAIEKVAANIRSAIEGGHL
jgi:vacuolar-type H+-ATPase subunit H